MGLINKEWMDAYHQGLNLTLDNMKLETSLSLQELLQTIQEDTNTRLSSLENTIQEEVNPKISNIESTLDDKDLPKINNNRLEITDSSGNRYFTTITLLLAPKTPDINNRTQTISSGNAKFYISYQLGATPYYSILNNSVWGEWVEGSSITIASGFNPNTISNVAKTTLVKLKAILNGEESDESKSISLIINPTLANAGTVSVVRNDHNNDYSTSATVTITPSPVVGAVNEYSIDNGANWDTLTETKTISNINVSRAKDYYRVRTTGYGTTAYNGNAAFTLNKKKFYYGFGPATLANEAAIIALGNPTESDIQKKTYNMSITLEQINNNNKYMWWCGLGTINAVSTGGGTVPVSINPVQVIAGYNCYRVQGGVVEVGNNEFIVS